MLLIINTLLLFYTDLNAKGAVYQAFEMYRLKSCVDFKPYEGEKTYIKFEKGDGYVQSNIYILHFLLHNCNCINFI